MRVYRMRMRMKQQKCPVVNAVSANAVTVAEFTLGQILLANTGSFRNAKEYTGPCAGTISAPVVNLNRCIRGLLLWWAEHDCAILQMR